MNAQIIETYDRMKRDLEAAARIQRRLLPTTSPLMNGVEVAWDLIPCEELAGDSLNMIRLDDHQLGVYVLDVSGHGLEAAMLAVTLHKVIDVLARGTLLSERAGTTQRAATPAEVAEELNRLFPIDPVTNQYFTMLYGVLDTDRMSFRYVAAGHHAPVYLPPHRPAFERAVHGFPIGVVPDVRYDEQRIDVEPGSRLYFYSDGMVDAECSNAGPFGKGRLMQAIDYSRPLELAQSVEHIIAHVREWNSTARLEDDASLLALEVR